MKLDFRSDIAGLRAVAVLSVLLFHYDVTTMSGGFVGVDVFFVISGYLITKSISDDIGRNGYSIGLLLVRFYSRRIRRIVPALALVLAATLVAGWFFLLPADYKTTGESAAYSAIGAGNLYFFWNTGYFDRAAELQPLLNMWSLGVEEQFYFIWPVLLAVILWAFKGKRAIVAGLVAALVVAGLAYSVHTAATNPTAAFYLPLPRAWELGVGALLAFLPAIRWKAASEIAGLAGLALIGWSVFALVGTEASPGWPMVPAVLGSALLVWPRAESWTARFLGIRPFTLIGDISYSLYLIHWPLLVLFRNYKYGGEPTRIDMIALGVFSTLLAYLSWRYIEQPVRLNRAFWTGRRVFGFLLPTTGAIACCGVAVVLLQGVPTRLPSSVQSLLTFRFAYAGPYREGACFLRPEQGVKEYDASQCLPHSRPKAILWGDSYAAHYYPGLSARFDERGIALGQLTASSCAPIVGTSIKNRPHCKDLKDFALATILRENPDLVILSAYWQSDEESMKKLGETIDKLAAAGIKIAMLGEGPYYLLTVPDILARRIMSGNNNTMSGTSLNPSVYSTDHKMKHLFSDKVIYVSVLDAVCTQAGCPMMENGSPVHWDRGHLTSAGSALFAEKIAPPLVNSVIPTLAQHD